MLLTNLGIVSFSLCVMQSHDINVVFSMFLFCSFNVVDGSKFHFQLTSYLAGKLTLETIMLDGVIPNLDVDPVIVIPNSPSRLLGFGPNAFSVH